ncbi:hypothetical protein CI610_01541 [invertebrate metagenome]|uniref:Uncharacterized protein n=1 Tax=invertebrate metagenome TaxID=1711999 RepID=A0A2H9T8B1_9ZZZZ
MPHRSDGVHGQPPSRDYQQRHRHSSDEKQPRGRHKYRRVQQHRSDRPEKYSEYDSRERLLPPIGERRIRPHAPAQYVIKGESRSKSHYPPEYMESRRCGDYAPLQEEDAGVLEDKFTDPDDAKTTDAKKTSRQKKVLGTAAGGAAVGACAIAGAVGYLFSPEEHTFQPPLGETEEKEWAIFSEMLQPFKNLPEAQREKAVLILMQDRLKEHMTYGLDENTEGQSEFISSPSHILADGGKGIDCDDYTMMCERWGEIAKSEGLLPEEANLYSLSLQMPEGGHVVFVYESPPDTPDEMPERYVIDTYVVEKIADNKFEAHFGDDYDINNDDLTSLHEYISSTGASFNVESYGKTEIGYNPLSDDGAKVRINGDVFDEEWRSQIVNDNSIGESISKDSIIDIQKNYIDAYGEPDIDGFDASLIREKIDLLEAKKYIGTEIWRPWVDDNGVNRYSIEEITPEKLGVTSGQAEKLIGEYSEGLGREFVREDFYPPTESNNEMVPDSSDIEDLGNTAESTVETAASTADDDTNISEKLGLDLDSFTDPITVGADAGAAFLESALVTAMAAKKLYTVNKRRKNIERCYEIKTAWEEKQKLQSPIRDGGDLSADRSEQKMAIRSMATKDSADITPEEMKLICSSIRKLLLVNYDENSRKTVKKLKATELNFNLHGQSYLESGEERKEVNALLEPFGFKVLEKENKTHGNYRLSVNNKRVNDLLSKKVNSSVRNQEVEDSCLTEKEFSDFSELCFMEGEISESFQAFERKSIDSFFSDGIDNTQTEEGSPIIHMPSFEEEESDSSNSEITVQQMDCLKDILKMDHCYVDAEAVEHLLESLDQLMNKDDIPDDYITKLNQMKNIAAQFSEKKKKSDNKNSDDYLYFNDKELMKKFDTLLSTFGIKVSYHTDKILGRFRSSAHAVLHKVKVDKKKFFSVLKQQNLIPKKEAMSDMIRGSSGEISALQTLKGYDRWKVSQHKTDRNIKLASAVVSPLPVIDEVLKSIAYFNESRYRQENKTQMNKRLNESEEFVQDVGLSHQEVDEIITLLKKARKSKQAFMDIKRNKNIANGTIHTVAAAADLPSKLAGPVGVGVKTGVKLGAKVTAGIAASVHRGKKEKALKKADEFASEKTIYSHYKDLYLDAMAEGDEYKMQSIVDLVKSTFGVSKEGFNGLIRTNLVENNRFKLSFSHKEV